MKHRLLGTTEFTIDEFDCKPSPENYASHYYAKIRALLVVASNTKRSCDWFIFY
jgi:hypothetical protein